MAHMVPEYSNETFVSIIDERTGDSVLVQTEYADVGPNETIGQEYRGKWFCRLSAPGYLDCTDWSGPFETEAEARQHIYETYDVDPDSGDDLPETDEPDNLEPPPQRGDLKFG